MSAQQTFPDSTGGEHGAFAVTIYTDGGCDPNPGPGGWAAVLRFPDREIVLHGNAPQTTNNRMELEAAIAAMAYLQGRYGSLEADLYTDSQYLHQGITQWVDDWLARGWKTKSGQPVRNQGLWCKLYDLIHAHRVRWHWVKGHAGDPLNERVDRLAREARQRLSRAQARPTARSSPPSFSSLQDTSAERSYPCVELSIGASCRGSIGPGGWAAILRSDRGRKTLRGHERETTSNILYLRAATEGLGALRTPFNVTVYTVSAYLGQGASRWVQDWQRRGWRTRKGEPVKNRDLWEDLLKAARAHRVTWQVIAQKAGGQPLPADLAETRALAAQEARKKHAGRGAGEKVER